MTRFLRSSGILLLLAALTLSLSACDSGGSNDEDDDTPDVEEGRVEVSIDGDASGSFDGYAYFYEGADPESDERIFSIVLSNTDDATPDQQGSRFIWIARRSDRPSTGQHAFAQLDQNEEEIPANQFISVAWSVVSDVNTLSFYVSNGGTLTITDSSDDRVAGSFAIDAVGFTVSEDGQSTEEVNVTIEGAFDAESANAYFNPWMTN